MTKQTNLTKTLIASMNGSITKVRKNALTTELKTHLIDTCYCCDTEQWETGIRPEGEKQIIVEQYNNMEEAKEGHKKWVKDITENPKIELGEDVVEYGI